MQFKLDENLPKEVKDILVNQGHSAPTVLEQKLGGRPDPKIIEVCRVEKRVLVTLDWDFSDIRTYPPQKYSGIVVLNPPSQDKQSILNMILQLGPLLKKETLKGCLWIVEPGRLRIRDA